jgi:hypothetical protein
MKHLSLIIIFLFTTSSLFSQHKGVSISAGYFGYYAINPGAKVAIYIPLINLSKIKTIQRKGESKEIEKHTMLFINPFVGFYTKPLFYTNLIVGNNVGLKFSQSNSKIYQAVSLSIHYLANFEITQLNYNSQGKLVSETRDLNNFSVPSLNYELGYQFKPRWALYVRVMAGAFIALTPGKEHSFSTFVGLGFKYTFKKSKSSS